MALAIYALCAVAALACAILLLQGARKHRSGMLWWSGACFFLFSLANFALVAEDAYAQGDALWPVRHGLSLVAISALLYGLIFEEH